MNELYIYTVYMYENSTLVEQPADKTKRRIFYYTVFDYWILYLPFANKLAGILGGGQSNISWKI